MNQSNAMTKYIKSFYWLLLNYLYINNELQNQIIGSFDSVAIVKKFMIKKEMKSILKKL